jgi:rhodanese-related sulfurtransferase
LPERQELSQKRWSSLQILHSKNQSAINAMERLPLFLRAKGAFMKTIRPLELEALLEADNPVELIDIRVLEKFENVHVAGAHWVPLQEFTPADLVGTRELPLSEPLYLISDDGGLAQLTAENLERENYDNVVVIEGGMKAWQRDGLPVVRNNTYADWVAEHRERIGALGLMA